MMRSLSRPLQGLGRNAAIPRTTPTATVITTTSVRWYAGKRDKLPPNVAPTMRSMEKTNMKLMQAEGKSVAQSRTKMPAHQVKAQLSKLFAGHFVALPFSQVPKSPREFFSYQYNRILQHMTDFGLNFLMRWKSKPGYLSKPRAQIYRSPALAAGKALHEKLGQAIAEGNRSELGQICGPALYDTLDATIARRNPWEKLSWDIVATHSARIKTHRLIALTDPFPKDLMAEQAVVAIESTQKLERIDKRTGEAVPDSFRMQRKTEFVGIGRQWNSNTYKAEPWQVLGYTKQTTPDDWAEYKRLQKLQQLETMSKLK